MKTTSNSVDYVIKYYKLKYIYNPLHTLLDKYCIYNTPQATNNLNNKELKLLVAWAEQKMVITFY